MHNLPPVDPDDDLESSDQLEDLFGDDELLDEIDLDDDFYD